MFPFLSNKLLPTLQKHRPNLSDTKIHSRYSQLQRFLGTATQGSKTLNSIHIDFQRFEVPVAQAVELQGQVLGHLSFVKNQKILANKRHRG